MEGAGAGTSRRVAEHEATGTTSSAQRERGPVTSKRRVNRSGTW
jgi:hypothetical protein